MKEEQIVKQRRKLQETLMFTIKEFREEKAKDRNNINLCDVFELHTKIRNIEKQIKLINFILEEISEL
jgi:hypothetical protein